MKPILSADQIAKEWSERGKMIENMIDALECSLERMQDVQRNYSDIRAAGFFIPRCDAALKLVEKNILEAKEMMK